MAKANSTRSTSTTHAPKANPAVINPLIVEGSPDDTILGVSEVLAFLSGTMEQADSIPVDGGCTGLSRILDTCRAALTFHLQEGGAA